MIFLKIFFVTVLDATSKFPYAGLGYSSRTDFGNFDQCLTVDHKYTGGRILGKYCAGGMIIPDILGDVTDPSVSTLFLLDNLFLCS